VDGSLRWHRHARPRELDGEGWGEPGDGRCEWRGKITLLSLILAGIPQAYANDVRVFDRQRSFSIIDVTHDPRLLPPCIGHVRCLARGRVKTCKAR